MTELDVVCVPHAATGGWRCYVTVSDDDGTRTDHEVAVSRAEAERYAPGRDVNLLVNASFRFLLSKEPKESILRQFALSDIERYLPDYPAAIAARLRG